jgi:hypothetical protein
VAFLALVGGLLRAGRWRSQYWRLHGDLCTRRIKISTMEGEDPSRNLELEIHSLRAVFSGGILSER